MCHTYIWGGDLPHSHANLLFPKGNSENFLEASKLEYPSQASARHVLSVHPIREYGTHIHGAEVFKHFDVGFGWSNRLLCISNHTIFSIFEACCLSPLEESRVHGRPLNNRPHPKASGRQPRQFQPTFHVNRTLQEYQVNVVIKRYAVY